MENTLVDRLLLKFPATYRLFCPSLSGAFSCETHLTKQEIILLSRLARGKSRIAEIGSYKGASACAFGAAVRRNRDGGKIFCIDTWNNDAMTEGRKDTWTDFVRNTESFAHLIITLRGWSFDLTEHLLTLTPHLDLLFIDGDHNDAAVQRDWELYKKFLRSGSTIAFHDFGWAPGVQNVVKNNVLPHVKEYGSLPNLWWGVLK
jgi:predicted O-methyltransferase YrrM